MSKLQREREREREEEKHKSSGKSIYFSFQKAKVLNIYKYDSFVYIKKNCICSRN